MSDRPYEKLIKQIKKIPSAGTTSCFLATMQSATTASRGDYDYDADDLYILDGVEVSKGDDVLMMKINDEKFIIVGKVKNL